MAEIIEIGSSSPLSSPGGKVEAKTTFQIPIDFIVGSDGSDGCEDWDSLDFTIDRPSKKRRIAPEIQNKKVTSETLLFDLSSDQEEPPQLRRITSAGCRDRLQCSNAATTTFDEITFSSSAPELSQSKANTGKKTWNDSQDDINLSFGGESTDAGYSHRTAQLLATLSQPILHDSKVRSRPAKVDTVRKALKSTSKSESRDEILFTSSPEKAKPLKKPKPSAVTKANRDAEREAEKERKRLERERKTQEKQKAADLAEVNKARTNKKSTASEMIVDVTSSLQGTSIGNQVEQYMKQAEIEMHYFDDEINLMSDVVEKNHFGNVIRWRRKVGSAYNDEQGLWEPTSRTRIEREEHILIHMPATEFVATMVSRYPVSSMDTVPSEATMKANIDAHVVSMRSRYHECIPVYVIEGMSTWLKKNANAKNRQYAAAVRAQVDDAATEASNPVSNGAQPRSKKRKKPAAPSVDLSSITSAQVEDILLHLQLAHQPIFIQHTASPANTASQILTLTQHLSTRPYRLAQLDYNLRNASFCMDSGQVKTGENARETFAKMLQEVQRVTPSMAYGILDGWSSVTKLVSGFEEHGNLLLEDVRKSLNKDGAWSERRLGPMVSKRLFKVFMGRDPTATDGMS
ncbi:uncharacterized protein A1O9_09788 [Exophiala aquamarina CBS 119918]|uniref:ERCC4 domain-containing protein n=1 Tax=Exophiala aquamarina CBS 119918 TaxID=1182545 RepID=A0A072P3Y5_9EURO|nr:uncharacterized protein A1O9_09788 [Exophiala aquamarina CBS 119918]KEF53993.1 hypothetical protein A1O9_09788 [Exophiala aquamarina CBS 119918]